MITFFKTYFSWLDQLSQMAYKHFGLLGQMVFFILIFYLVYLIVTRIIKSIFDLALWVVLPSVLLSATAAYLLSFNFFQILPVCACLMIIISFVRH
ncbi:MAG TPA: hypothetical protein VGB16_01610 [candidate division Zixibacteria bacterium]